MEEQLDPFDRLPEIIRKHGYTGVPLWIIDGTRRLTNRQYIVLLDLLGWCRGAQRQCDPMLKEIGARTGLSEAHVSSIIGELEAMTLVAVNREGFGARYDLGPAWQAFPSQQFRRVPNVLLQNWHRLGITVPELRLWVKAFNHWRCVDKLPFFAMEKVAAALGLNRRSAARHVREANQVVTQYAARRRGRASEYDPAPGVKLLLDDCELWSFFGAVVDSPDDHVESSDHEPDEAFDVWLEQRNLELAEECRQAREVQAYVQARRKEEEEAAARDGAAFLVEQEKSRQIRAENEKVFLRSLRRLGLSDYEVENYFKFRRTPFFADYGCQPLDDEALAELLRRAVGDFWGEYYSKAPTRDPRYREEENQFGLLLQSLGVCREKCQELDPAAYAAYQEWRWHAIDSVFPAERFSAQLADQLGALKEACLRKQAAPAGGADGQAATA